MQLMQINLLFPFQTGPGAVCLRANPEAAGHVVALLLEAGKGQFAEKSFTLERFGSSIVHLFTVIIEIESVPKVLVTGLTPEAARWGWWRRTTSSLPSSPLLNHNLGLDWNQQVALICRQFDHMLPPVQVYHLKTLGVVSKDFLESRGGAGWCSEGEVSLGVI